MLKKASVRFEVTSTIFVVLLIVFKKCFSNGIIVKLYIIVVDTQVISYTNEIGPTLFLSKRDYL